MNDNLRRAMHRAPALRQPTKPEPALMKALDCLLNRTESTVKASEPVQTAKLPSSEPEGQIQPIHENHPKRPRTNAVVEPDSCHAPLAEEEVQGFADGRFLIRLVSVRKRLADEDGLCEKYLVDCCRYAGLLPNDAPGICKIETTQRKAQKGEQEHTEITIITP